MIVLFVVANQITLAVAFCLSAFESEKKAEEVARQKYDS